MAYQAYNSSDDVSIMEEYQHATGWGFQNLVKLEVPDRKKIKLW